MSSKRPRKCIDATKSQSKRIMPKYTEEQKAKRAKEREELYRELREMSKEFQDPNRILALQPKKNGEQQKEAEVVTDVEKWCSCGQCIQFPTAEECVCCKDIHNVTLKMEEEPTLPCITEHKMFSAKTV